MSHLETSPGVVEAALPLIDRFEPRHVSEHYGAMATAAEYCGLRSDSPPPHGAWMHGWTPRYIAADPEFGEEYLKIHEAQAGREHIWTGVAESVPAIRAYGWSAQAIGLPIVYLPPSRVPRRPGTLLVMPAHSGEVSKHDDWPEREYAAAVAGLRDSFSTIVVCVHPSCIVNGLWIRAFEEQGIPVIEGAHFTDRNALRRVQALLSQFEYMTTNGFGSHIAYAAYFGAKVSIFGPFAHVRLESQTRDACYRPGNRFMELWLHAQSEGVLREHYPFLFVHPRAADERREWGRGEVGDDHKVSPETMRRLFRWQPSHLLRWRLVGRHLRSLREEARALVPAPAKRWIKRLIGVGRAS